ncbi:sodium:glutamate symporter [candidate division TA06 bacterium B3_TA06]|uniref:Sodium:glutamate symporter n=1 Tax=candidate division TA06 bacterium B3_TA06 TaxID=2012487 RepID=A0A532V6T0_UNCT6|nr:MAG: sodium:glutamate symporter [candidate division TA06 bacterium B3_TA06]
MLEPWSLIVDLALLGVFLLIAVVIRRFVSFIRKFRIPDAIIAGFIGLIVGPSVLNILPKITRIHGDFTEVITPLQSGTLLTLIYHLMGIAFIALALKSSEGKGRTRSAVSGGFYMVASYAIQGFIGLAVTLILMLTIFPDLFPSFGFLLPFGFGQGPGLASQMGKLWSDIMVPGTATSAFPNGASVGLSFSTIGFLWACIVGVPLMNILIRRRRRRGEPEPGFGKPPPPQPGAHFLIEKERDYSGMARSIDKATTQLMLIGGIYIVLLLGLEGLTWLLNTLVPGKLSANMLKLFWGFHFGFGALIGTLVGKFVRKMEDKGWVKGGKGTNNYLLQHIGGTAIDFMIAASIAAINVRVLGPYIVPILIVTTIGGVVTIGYIWFFVRRVWPKTFVEHFVTFFGTHTGTLATGMALLRGVDPQFRTSAASDAIYGSGIGLLMGIPLIAMASLPATGYELGNPNYYWITLLLIIGYLAVILFIWFNPWTFKFLTKHTRGSEEKEATPSQK